MEQTYFPIVYSWLFCCKLIDHTCMGLFLGSLLYSIDTCHFYVNTTLFWLCYLCNIVWNQGGWCLQLCSSFSRLLWLFWIFCGFIQILGLFISVKNVTGILTGIALHLQIALGSMDILIYSSNPWAWNIFTFICVFFNSFYFFYHTFWCTHLSLPWLNVFIYLLFLMQL